MISRCVYKALLLVLLPCLGTPGLLPAQTAAENGWFARLNPEIEETEVLELSAGEQDVFLKMEFARATILNPAAWQGDGSRIRHVDLLLTKYPHDLNSWEVGYDALMEKRFSNLMELVPSLAGSERVSYRVVLQTQAKDLESARQMNHGFLIYSSPPQEPSETGTNDITLRPPRYEETDLQTNFDQVMRTFYNEESYHDSTAIHTFIRHPEWSNLAVVSDWTASMYRHGAQFLHWVRENRGSGTIQKLVFFNDGDGKYDEDKVIGATGGIYPVAGESEEELVVAMEAVTKGGEGGDHRENDLEALLYADSLCPDCKDLILIADNSGPVRDLSLLIQVSRPVRIVLCGVYKQNIHPDYLTIAHFTGGSIHTRDRDYEDIDAMLAYGHLSLGENEYELKGKRFVKKRKY